MFLKLSFKSNKKTFAETNIKSEIIFGFFAFDNHLILFINGKLPSIKIDAQL